MPNGIQIFDEPRHDMCTEVAQMASGHIVSSGVYHAGHGNSDDDPDLLVAGDKNQYHWDESYIHGDEGDLLEVSGKNSEPVDDTMLEESEVLAYTGDIGDGETCKKTGFVLDIVPYTAGPGGFLLGYLLEDPTSGERYQYVEPEYGGFLLVDVKTRRLKFGFDASSFDISLLRTLLEENKERLNEICNGWYLEEREKMFIFMAGKYKTTQLKNSEALGVTTHLGVRQGVPRGKHRSVFGASRGPLGKHKAFFGSVRIR